MMKLHARLSIACAVAGLAFALLAVVEDIRTVWLFGLDDPHMHIGHAERPIVMVYAQAPK